MEINDEHRTFGTMTGSEEANNRHLFESIKNESTKPFLLDSGSWSTSQLSSETLNRTETSVINFDWNTTNANKDFIDEPFANHSYNSNFSTISAFNNSLEFNNATLWDVWQGKPFPSGYTQLAIVTLAFFLACIMILVVVGNMLVCIAIATEKSLKPVQNWFIASLAVSDFLIGLVIMPFSLARELMGYWMFGQVWCDIHAALDVFLCTASINSLFLISLDRYWSITQAVRYLKERTPSRAAFMIGFVWIFSALVSLPPLVGWKKAEQSSEYPQCNLSEDVGYVLYSSIGSFYFPALMMVFVYVRIFIAARSRARRHLEKKRLKISTQMNVAESNKEKSTTTTVCTSFSNPSPPENKDQSEHNLSCSQPVMADSNTKLSSYNNNNNKNKNNNSNKSDDTVSNIPAVISPPPPQIIIETTTDSRRQSWNIISTSELISSIKSDQLLINNDEQCQTIVNAEYEDNESSNIDPADSIDNDNKINESDKSTSKSYFPRLKSVSNKAFRFRKPKLNGLTKENSLSKSVTLDDDSDTIDSPTSKEHHSLELKAFLSAPKLQSKFGSTLSIADYDDSDLIEEDKKKGKGCRVQYHNPPVVGIHIPSDAERHKRKIAKARERRATLIVGLIMAAFITAWLPFFVLYVLAALCVSCKETIPEGVFAVAFWLGYCNSAANPIIYTIFNRDYRKAFRKILFK